MDATGNRVMRILVASVVLAALLLAGYTWLALHWSYSTGERVGYVQKFSRKGWLCKSWEGEMALVSVPGTVAEKFYFTVRDEAVVARIHATAGSRVALTYEQHVGVPTSCFGETQYFVTGVRVLEAPNLPGLAPPPAPR